ncbi:hypothetical protein SAMD00023353_2000220 [Rosellinia necatrix]|uniref:Cytochrome p450 protein n=1 Tax=Rosellinia necatrix TaxID=77044 RepID=A0A1W2TF88_ROSNE|nr:hypothetical protein SAMD00023353_2000220 [Rosellinia necatrix]
MADYFSSRDPYPSNYKVYLGMWTNWSRGPVFGATLTLDRRQGSVLISFTAFFVTIVASRFWRIACSIIHRKLSAAEDRDTLHHQRQAIFRNSSSSGSGLWSLIQISWAWRQAARKSLSRTFPPIAFASICLLAFSLASGFSSSISTTIGDEVLVNGANCGYVNSLIGKNNSHNSWLEWSGSLISNAANYAQQVYSPARTGIFSNTAYVRKTLDTTYNRQAPCPFQGICRSNTSNLLLDTGYISIRDHLGVNLQPDEDILYRTIAHCAPLMTEGRSEPTQYHGSLNYTGYSYGPKIRPTGDGTDRGYTIVSNYTIVVGDSYSQSIMESNMTTASGYGIVLASSLTADGDAWSGTFLPEKALRRPDADIYLYFLSGNGVYTSEPVYDPWYRSYIPSQYESYLVRRDGLTTSRITTYQPAEAASPLGCMMQYQICQGSSANKDSCGPLASFNDAIEGAYPHFGVDPSVTMEEAIYATPPNKRVGRFLWWLEIMSYYPNDIQPVVWKMGSRSLASSRTLTGVIQGPLPKEQWKVDVSNWWNISLSLLQASLVDTANGATDPNFARLQVNATTKGQKSLCQNQKILSTSYTSVSLFGLFIIYIPGVLIIILSLVLDPILSYSQKRWKNREYENLEWACNETLQLQRLAYEESGQGDWSACIDSVPVTTAEQELAPLNVMDPKHPRLRRFKLPDSSKEFPVSHPSNDEHSPDTSDNQEDGALQEEHQASDVSSLGIDRQQFTEGYQSGDQALHAADDAAVPAPGTNSPTRISAG